MLGYAAYTFAIGGLAVWMPTFLERVRGRELASADFFVGAVTAVAGLGGTFVGGYLGDRLTARVREGHLWLSGVSTLLAVGPAWLALTSDLAGDVSDQLLRGGIAAVPQHRSDQRGDRGAVPADMRAMAMAVSIFVIHALGDAISPPLIGLLADARGLALAVLIVPAALAVSGVIWTITAWKKFGGSLQSDQPRSDATY